MAEIDQLIEDCENRESRLSDWERSFVDSLKSQRAQGRPLTKRQVERLEELWDKATEIG